MKYIWGIIYFVESGIRNPRSLIVGGNRIFKSSIYILKSKIFMSYLVFARKWRPQSFSDVVGQEHITQTLVKAIEKNRVAHAYIFTGTRGVGKTTTARILARALNCDKGPTPKPCGECEPCKNIINGSSFDVLEIDGASNNSVDDIREIRENVRYSSMGGKHRIYVIDEVHMLSKSAFNALLKTLEEPPENVIFIFATTEPQKIPATIHSRCQRFDFRRISAEQIAARLAHICASEKIAFDKAALALVARKAEGSMRDALSLLDQVYSYSHESINEAAVRTVLGIMDTELYDTIMRAVVEKNPQPAVAAVEDILSRGFDLHEFVLGLEDHIRTLLFCRMPGVMNNPRLDLPADTTGAFAKRASAFSEETLLRMAEIVRKTERDLRFSDFPRFLVELLLLKLVHLDDTVALSKLLESLGGAPQVAATPQTAPPPAVSTVPATSTAVPGTEVPDKKKIRQPTLTLAEPVLESDAAPDNGEADVDMGDLDGPPAAPPAGENLQQQWPKFMEQLVHDWPAFGYHLSVAYVVSSTANSVELRFPAACHFQFGEVTKKKNRDEIQKKLCEFAKADVALHITIEPAGAPAAQKPPEPSAAAGASLSIQDEIGREPIIGTVLDIFDGAVL
jgi:DNA polymerase III subunit gamma/tau